MTPRASLARPTAAVLLTTVALLVGACGGSGDSTSDASASDASGSDASGSDIVVDEVSDAGSATGDGAASLAAAVSAIEATGYECTPESFVMTSSVRETCLTTSSISLSAYAWGSADLLAAQVDGEVTCSADSGLGQLTSLRGDDWVVVAVPLSGSTTPEVQASVDEALAAVSATLGGTIVTTPCS